MLADLGWAHWVLQLSWIAHVSADIPLASRMAESSVKDREGHPAAVLCQRAPIHMAKSMATEKVRELGPLCT